MVRRPLTSSRGLKLGGIPMQHCGVSDLMNDTSLDGFHAGDEPPSAEIAGLVSPPQSDARVLEYLSRAPTLSHENSPKGSKPMLDGAAADAGARRRKAGLARGAAG